MLRLLLVVFFSCSVMAGQVLAGDESEIVENNGSVYKEGTNTELAGVTENLKGQFPYQSAMIVLESLDQMTADAIVSNEDLRRRIGIRRDIGQLDSSREVLDTLSWQSLAGGGQVTTLTVTSPSAAAIRIGMAVNSLPAEAELRFFDLADGTPGNVYLVTGKEILDLLQLNMGADPENPDASLYWSPVVKGNTIGIEIHLPQNVDYGNVDIVFPALSHLGESPYGASEMELNFQGYGDSNPCQNDATCYANWLNMRKATAKMVFTVSGSSYICSGTLLNDTDPNTYIPYFISANHCIDSQTVASSLNTLWHFESASCNSSVRNSAYAVRYGGAQLLWTGGMTSSPSSSSMDTSFFRLRDQPPGGVYFAGWNTAIPGGGKTGVHHPKGDWKKISFGGEAGYHSCYSISSTSFSCSPSSTGNFLRVNWTDGGTEGGSSGSGIYHNNDQLIGDLTGGGGGDCAGSRSYYSTFKAAFYSGNLGRWLNAGPTSKAPNLTSINALLLKPSSDSDPCMATISLGQSINGAWTSACSSVNRLGRYAKYYTFSISSTRSVQIDLTSSSVDTYMFLLSGGTKNGSVIESDDDGGSGFNSRIVRTLSPGTYTIEATTYSSARTGSFVVTLN